MKAPEKLYLPKRNKLPLDVVRGGEWYEKDPQCMYGSVEYVRTDAFIEKALKYIKANVDRIVNNQRAVCMGLMDGEFIQYMEGE